MSDYVYESGMSTKRRRQRRTAITMLLTLLLLFGAFWWAWSYMRDGDDKASGKPTTTLTPGACVDAKTATFNVYNATGRSGLARKAADALTSAGFKVGKVANDPLRKKLPGHVEIRFGPDGAPYATSFKEDYGQAGSLSPLDRTGSDVDLVLGDSFQEWKPFPTEPPC